MEFHFLVQIFCTVRKLEVFSLLSSKNMPAKGWVFSIILVMENLNWSSKVMEKSWNFIFGANILYC